MKKMILVLSLVLVAMVSLSQDAGDVPSELDNEKDGNMCTETYWCGDSINWFRVCQREVVCDQQNN